MTRARTDLDDIEASVANDLKAIRDALNQADGTPADEAMCGVEMFCAIALRVMRKTNPSKVRSEARTMEIRMRIAGADEMPADGAHFLGTR